MVEGKYVVMKVSKTRVCEKTERDRDRKARGI